MRKFEDVYDFVVQAVFGIISVGGWVYGMTWLLGRGYNEWLSYLAPLVVSVIAAFMVCNLINKIIGHFFQ